MKGIILAGGSGMRLYPATKTVSKQLLPVYDKPMIYYPLSLLMMAGIQDIMIISTDSDLPLFERLLGTGEMIGLNLSYKVQAEPRGVAEAFIIAEDFIGENGVALVLGDNILYGNGLIELLTRQTYKVSGATIFAYSVSHPEAYGVVELNDSGKVLSIEEKPKVPRSSYAVPGIYFYDNQVIEIAKGIEPSARGELEITAINNVYLSKGMLRVERLGRGMTWMDTGTHDDLLEASNLIKAIQQRQGLQIACVEEIAYLKGFIGQQQLWMLAESYGNTGYGSYLKQVAEGISVEWNQI